MAENGRCVSDQKFIYGEEWTKERIEESIKEMWETYDALLGCGVPEMEDPFGYEFPDEGDEELNGSTGVITDAFGFEFTGCCSRSMTRSSRRKANSRKKQELQTLAHLKSLQARKLQEESRHFNVIINGVPVTNENKDILRAYDLQNEATKKKLSY